MTCGVHLQANRQCPYEALYVLRWTLPDEQVLLRRVCLGHLQRGIDEALEQCSRSRPVVEVRLGESSWRER